MTKGIGGLNVLQGLAGGFLAIALASAMLPECLKDAEDIEEFDKEFDNLNTLDIDEIDLDKKLNIKRLINNEGELIDERML
jgi:hypothetical protein